MHDAYQQDLLVPDVILVQPMSRSVEDVLSTSSSMMSGSTRDCSAEGRWAPVNRRSAGASLRDAGFMP
jgi:hypothetical protein